MGFQISIFRHLKFIENFGFDQGFDQKRKFFRHFAQNYTNIYLTKNKQFWVYRHFKSQISCGCQIC